MESEKIYQHFSKIPLKHVCYYYFLSSLKKNLSCGGPSWISDRHNLTFSTETFLIELFNGQSQCSGTKCYRGRRGRDRMVVGFTTTYSISAYHHESCEFEFRYYVIKFVRDLRQVGGFLRAVPEVDKERP